MVRAFNDREKNLIREKLIERGKELFSTLGLKKTSISDLTKAVGIAQGSFYLFFDSKEELYFEIMEQEEEALKSQLLTQVFTAGGLNKETLKELLVQGLHVVEQNPIIRRIFLEDEFEVLKRKLPPEKLAKHIENDTHQLIPFITQGQKEGIFIKAKPEVISAVIRSYFLISLHKKEIGTDVYTETLDLLATFIADGLFPGKE